MVFLLIGILVFPAVASAQSEHINSFDDQIVVHRDGSFDVEEKILYDFGDSPHHGIFRTIPLSSKVGDLYRNIQIKVGSVSRDGESEKYSTSFSGGNEAKPLPFGNETIKIGDPDFTITGTHSYLIDYRVINQIGNYSDHDELYWNVTGNGWTVPINEASVKVTPDFSTQITNSKCFTGTLGSKEQNCSEVNGDKGFIQTTKSLGVNEGLTAVFAFPSKTFPMSTLSNISGFASVNPKLWKFFIPAVVILGALYYLILPVWLFIWYLKHKHKNRFGKVSVNFDIPEDTKGKVLPPAEAGTVDATKLDNNDIIATVFDLAIRKYIKIAEVKAGKSVLGMNVSRDVYSLSKLSADESKLTVYEKKLFDWLFADGDVVMTSEIRSRFEANLTYADMETAVFASLEKRGLFTRNPKYQRLGFVVGAVVSLISLNILLLIVFGIFYKAFNGRTEDGDLVDWKIDGLKLFLKNMSREYKWQAKELYTVEKMIPYAICFGYIDKFMEQLKLSYPDYHPYWYSGNSGFYLAYGSMFSSLNQSITPIASASSSGFSGGGFSGGGGGGGGGGSW